MLQHNNACSNRLILCSLFGMLQESPLPFLEHFYSCQGFTTQELHTMRIKDTKGFPFQIYQLSEEMWRSNSSLCTHLILLHIICGWWTPGAEKRFVINTSSESTASICCNIDRYNLFATHLGCLQDDLGFGFWWSSLAKTYRHLGKHPRDPSLLNDLLEVVSGWHNVLQNVQQSLCVLVQIQVMFLEQNKFDLRIGISFSERGLVRLLSHFGMFWVVDCVGRARESCTAMGICAVLDSFCQRSGRIEHNRSRT